MYGLPVYNCSRKIATPFTVARLRTAHISGRRTKGRGDFGNSTMVKPERFGTDDLVDETLPNNVALEASRLNSGSISASLNEIAAVTEGGAALAASASRPANC